MTEVKLSDGQTAAAHMAYDELTKSDGLRINDISAAMKKLGHNIKPDWLENMEDEIDQEGTGFISFEEFTAIVTKKMQADEDERELKEIFRVLDKEKKGEVIV